MKWSHLILTMLIGVVTIMPTKGFSQCRGGEVFQVKGEDVKWAAVKTTCFKAYVARQRNTNWCWAACIQMVLNYQGVDVSQETIVEKVFGYKADRPANAYTIAVAVRGNWPGRVQISSHVDNPRTVTANAFIEDLTYKYPLIVGLRMPGQDVGHAYVLTGISFTEDMYNNKKPIEVILRDPWPSNPSRLKMSWSEFYSRCHTVVHIYPSNQ